MFYKTIIMLHDCVRYFLSHDSMLFVNHKQKVTYFNCTFIIFQVQSFIFFFSPHGLMQCSEFLHLLFSLSWPHQLLSSSTDESQRHCRVREFQHPKCLTKLSAEKNSDAVRNSFFYGMMLCPFSHRMSPLKTCVFIAMSNEYWNNVITLK